MTWMNEYDVEEALDTYGDLATEVPNLYTGSRVLAALVTWTNENSDGWPYWNKPSQAANKLQMLLHNNMYAARFGCYQGTAEPLRDESEADLLAALKPIKAFLTRQGVDHGAVLPWAAILPAA